MEDGKGREKNKGEKKKTNWVVPEEAHSLIGRLIAAVQQRTISAAIDYDPNHFLRLSSVLFMIAPYRLVMPGIVCIYWLLSSGRERNTHVHERLSRENKGSELILKFNSVAFPSCNFSLAVANTIWRRRRRRSTLIIMVIKLVDNTRTLALLWGWGLIFASFGFFSRLLFFCKARDSVLPVRSCINYLSTCAADVLSRIQMHNFSSPTQIVNSVELCHPLLQRKTLQ